MKISVTGSKGCIGSRLVHLGCEPLLCDVTNPEEVSAELERVNPDIIIHCASISSVDACERDYDKALQVNVRGTNIVCEYANEIIGNGRVVLISSDQVFDGVYGRYAEGDEPNPVHPYGMLKVFAEGVVTLYDGKIIRISRCFDGDSRDIAEYLESLEDGAEIRVPDFLYRSYCHTDFIAHGIWEYANRFFDMPDVLHLAGDYTVSFYKFMRLVADEYGYNDDLVRPRGESKGFPPRPKKCGLDVSLAKSLNLPIYSLPESIQRMKNETLGISA